MESFSDSFLCDLFYHLQRSKKSLYALVSLLSLCLLAYNSASIFSTQVPISPKTPPEPASFLPENVAGNSRKFISVSSSAEPSSSSVQNSMKEKRSSPKLKTHFSLLHKNRNLAVPTNRPSVYSPKRRKRYLVSKVKPFEVRVKEFFNTNSSYSACKFQFFMTWISSMESFGDRELFAINSLFKAHPRGCLIIASNSLDSRIGIQILKPFLDRGFRVIAISPDFNYLFKNTPAEAWYNQLMLGNVNPGEVSLGQNLSNLLRLGLLYRFGGVYLDTYVIVLKNLGELRNVIGAQTVDIGSGN